MLNPWIARSRFLACGVLAAFALLTLTSCSPKTAITQGELLRREQELFDSVVAGDQAPWKKYFADDCMYFDEKGRNMNKANLVATITPLPTGYSGSIQVVKPQSHIDANAAILSYDLDETETVFGQKMTARYHGTDTWLRRNEQWQIVAGQMLRYYEDPAPGSVDEVKSQDYVGVYELAPGNQLTISIDSKKLYRQRGDKPREELIPETTGIFFRQGVEGRILFHRDGGGNVDTLIDRRNNEDIVWKKLAVQSQRRRKSRLRDRSSIELTKKLLFIHAVLKRFAPVDEYYRDLIVIEASNLNVGINVDFAPREAAAFMQLDDALLDDFAEMTSLAGIHHDFPRLSHARECSSFGA